MGIIDFLGQCAEAIGDLTGDLKNPSILQAPELRQWSNEIQRVCGHGPVYAIKGRNHCYECNGIRFHLDVNTGLIAEAE